MAAKNKKRYFIIGTTVMGLLILSLIAVAVIASPNFFRPKTYAETYFTESVNGLDVGAPVKFRGVPIGKVTEIDLSSTVYPENHIFLFSKNKSVAVVKMLLYFDEGQVRQELRKYIEEGLRAQTQLSGLTGTLYISLDFLNPKEFPAPKKPPVWEANYLVIPSAPSLTTQITESVSSFLSRLDKIHPDQKLMETIPNAKELIANLDRIADGLNAHTLNLILTNFDKLLKTASNKISDLDVKTLKSLIAQLDSTAADLDKQVGTSNIDKLMNDINSLSAKFDAMAKNNQYDVRALMLSLLQVTQNLDQLTSQLATDPSSLVRPRPGIPRVE
ncbi:MlaD family protein [Turicimonas muris]|uniref:MCE family protein n=1 Tax=Turicimonas muris TaxID=1796652 RepID=A0A227KKM3_9BURK|nr:MlaD family protein [Turicimonas muris]ANU67123.1 hypothetical protein A4V04_12315 [Burkholderiales bacterium YL45]OXE47749.1 MCE family protein [Turicimonas muris]QQQ95978.1 MCE family protein [Turicimonas muris]